MKSILFPLTWKYFFIFLKFCWSWLFWKHSPIKRSGAQGTMFSKIQNKISFWRQKFTSSLKIKIIKTLYKVQENVKINNPKIPPPMSEEKRLVKFIKMQGQVFSVRTTFKRSFAIGVRWSIKPTGPKFTKRIFFYSKRVNSIFR